MAREAPLIHLFLGEPEMLQQLVRARSTSQGLALRARIILRCAQPDRPTNNQVADELDCNPDTVARWRRRFYHQRLAGLHDLPRSGRPAAFSPSGASPRSGSGYHQTRRRGHARLPLVAG